MYCDHMLRAPVRASRGSSSYLVPPRDLNPKSTRLGSCLRGEGEGAREARTYERAYGREECRG